MHRGARSAGEIWFDADVQSGIPGNGYPFFGDADGVTITHPDYDPNAFFLRDLGVVRLSAPYLGTGGQFGTLPSLNQLDAMKTKRGKSDQTFTAVGYGLQMSFPTAAAWKNSALRIRMVAHPKSQPDQRRHRWGLLAAAQQQEAYRRHLLR